MKKKRYKNYGLKRNKSQSKYSVEVSPCKGIQDTLGLWIPRRGFRIPITGFQIFFSGTLIPDSDC